MNHNEQIEPKTMRRRWRNVEWKEDNDDDDAYVGAVVINVKLFKNVIIVNDDDDDQMIMEEEVEVCGRERIGMIDVLCRSQEIDPFI